MENQQRKKIFLARDPIPADVLVDILSRVPSKSIARFRCVSKYWSSILQRPDFTELFLSRCPRILFTLKVNEEFLYFSSPQHPNPDDNSSLVATRFNTSFPKYATYDIQTMLGGLVLHQGYFDRKFRVICNPATGEYLTLPKVKASIEGIFYKFGYDPINQQFKVLCMMSSSNTHRVLTLENGKRLWRKMESKFCFISGYRICGDICINGVLYFGTSFHESDAIVCFEVRSEKLSLIKIGKGMLKEGSYTIFSTTLINYQGKCGIHEEDKLHFNLLVLEGAENHKWSKHAFEYPPLWNNIVFENQLRFIGMTSTGEMVFAPYLLYDPFYVYYYSFVRNTFTKVTIQGFEEFSNEGTIINTFLDYAENITLFK